MRIDGREIAKGIFEDLKVRVEELKITPHLVIILVGNDPASVAYVRQKELKAAEIGAKATVLNYESGIRNNELLKIIQKLNNDKNVHGIIVQRPLPKHIDTKKIVSTTDPIKDVDSFHPISPFYPPLAQAIIVLINKAFKLSSPRHTLSQKKFLEWLHSKKIVVIGKGVTAGGPTITRLKKLGSTPFVIDSKTKEEERKKLIKKADIIVTTVGKEDIILPEMLTKGVILVGAGMNKGHDGKLHGDYEDEEIKDVASFYTPIPGGVGPVNVAMLLENLILAAEKMQKMQLQFIK